MAFLDATLKNEIYEGRYARRGHTEALVDDLVQLLDALGTQHAILVDHDRGWGGRVRFSGAISGEIKKINNALGAV